MLVNPLGLSAETAGVYSYQRPGVQGVGLHLTADDVAALDAAIPVNVGTAYSVRTPPADWWPDCGHETVDEYTWTRVL